MGVLALWAFSNAARSRKPPDPSRDSQDLELRITSTYEPSASRSGSGVQRESGYRFRAWLDPSTPLEALQRHGEFSTGSRPPSDAPGGYWQYVWEGRDDEPQTRYGIPEGDVPAFLEFLKAFRGIVERPGSTEEKLALGERLYEDHQVFCEAIGERFPQSWFSEQLAKVDGIGHGTAWNLFQAGFLDVERLRLASDEELLAVPGVGPGRVTQIRGYFAPRRKRPTNLSAPVPVDSLPFNRPRRIARDIAEMLGVVKGVLADGVVTDEETSMLREWVRAHPDVTGEWAGRTLVERLERIFADGAVDDEERADLQQLLEELVGGGSGTLLGSSTATTLPLTRPPPAITFPGATFTFTGRFAFGPRTACEEEVRKLGGMVHPSLLTSTDYLVVGTFGSSDWVQSSYGTKIRKAVEYQRRGASIAIVTEDHWAQAVP